jgi:predicted dehydrogenase
MGIGKFHVQGWSALYDQGVTIAALCDTDEKKLRAFADQVEKEHGYRPELYKSYQEMFDTAHLDAVSICVPNFLHRPTAEAAFAAGCHVLLEKPMANTLENAQAILVAQKAAGTVGMGGLNNNYTPRWRLIKQMIEDGALGRIQRIRGWWTRRTGVPFCGMWFTQKQRSGGGPVIDLMPHILGCQLGWLDWPNLTYAWAQTTRLGGGNPARGPYADGLFDPDGLNDVEHACSVRYGTEIGVIIDVDVAWGQHTDRERMGFEIIGDIGTAAIERIWPTNDGDDTKAIDSLGVHTAVEIGDRWVNLDYTVDPDSNPTLADPFMGRTRTQAELLACIRDRSRVPHTGLDRLLAVQVGIDVAYASAEDGVPLHV